VTSDLFNPNRTVDYRTRQFVVLAWMAATGIFWAFSPFIFLPKPGEVWQSLHDLWFDQALGIGLLTSVSLNLEAIAIATIISLGLAYLGTIAFFRPVVSFIGKMRFLSLAGLGFAFTLMTKTGQELKLSVLVFFVTVYFVVSMADTINAIPSGQFDLAKTLRMGDWETLYEVIILGQSDQVFVVLRQTAAMSWAFIATAEGMAMSGGGIGMLLATSNRHFHLSDVMAIQLVILFLGLAQDYAIGALRNFCCPWVTR